MTFEKNARTGWRMLEYNSKKYPNYHNADNATGKIMEELYHTFMPRINNLVSAKEFDFLQERKKESKKSPQDTPALLEAERFHFLMQRIAIDSEHFGGPQLIAPAECEHLLDQRFLQLFRQRPMQSLLALEQAKFPLD